MTGAPDPGALRDRMPDALAALTRALDGADRRAGGGILGARAALDLRRLLAGLSAALVRLVIVAHAEARGLARPSAAGSVAQIHAQLRAERGDGRAWTRLMEAGRALFAEGGLLHPAALPLLAQLDDAPARAVLDALFPDGADALGDLEIEQVVGAYEGLIGFDLRVARGPTLLALPDHVGVDLEALLETPATKRVAWLAEITGSVGARAGAAITKATSVVELGATLARRASARATGVLSEGALYVEPGTARRRAGAHYTPRALTEPLVASTLAPLLERAGDDADALLSLKIADPAMGTGAFLVEACRQLAARLHEIDPSLDARRLVAERCLHGVDADPLAVELARVALWLLVSSSDAPRSLADAHLLVGDALIGSGAPSGPSHAAAEQMARTIGTRAFHWDEAFPAVRGFDAVIGNPPWVAYAGRAAQPLDDARFGFYLRWYPSFFGFRTLHGLFILRAATLLAPGGRLGMVVPTSVSDLGGYEPTRRAHDMLCEVDPELADFGDAFDGVFQPSMGLVSTRRAAPVVSATKSAPWRVARDDLDPHAAALLARLADRPPLPPECFGERGFQSTGADVKQLRACPRPEPPFVVPIREGSDLRAFRALPPRVHLDPSGLQGKLRAPEAWREVHVLVRQTARFPIAARADGVAFRNSILAGFAVDAHDADVLVAWLNAAPIRWLHFMRHRDARQGMPQVKIAHLRSIPRVPDEALAALRAMGAALGARNAGVGVEEQRALDELCAEALGLSNAERALVAAWTAANPAP